MKIHVCIYCKKEINYTNNDRKEIAIHYFDKHRFKLKQDYKNIAGFIKSYFYGNEIPQCQCGCGEIVDYFIPGKNKWAAFKRGHYVRLPDCNPTRDNKEIAQKSGRKTVETKNKRKIEGKIYSAWNKNLTIDDLRVKKYVEYSTGKTFEERFGNEIAKKLKQNLSKKMKERHLDVNFIKNLNEKRTVYWQKEENKKIISERSSKRILDGSFKLSNFERNVIDCLTKHNIEFIHQFRISDKQYNKVYDFRIKNILIEADGDYHHCNPEKFPNGPKYKIQFIHIENDKIKTQLAKDYGFILIRIWYSDFQKNPDILIQKINAALSAA